MPSIVFTYSNNTRTRRYGDFFIRQDYPPKGILLEGNLHIRTEAELSCVVKEMWAAFRDYEGQIRDEELPSMNGDDTIRDLEKRLAEAEQMNEEALAWIEELEKG